MTLNKLKLKVNVEHECDTLIIDVYYYSNNKSVICSATLFKVENVDGFNIQSTELFNEKLKPSYFTVAKIPRKSDKALKPFADKANNINELEALEAFYSNDLDAYLKNVMLGI